MRELLVKVSEFLGLYKYAMKLDNRWQMHRQNKAFTRYGLETLSAAEAAANDMGCKLFLAFGSLLGAYREKGFIPFDCDLDTGMLASERSEAFVKSMESHGLKLLRQYYVKSTGRVCEEKFEYKGVHLDVHYFYTNEQGDLYCDLCIPHETKPWREANATDGFPAIVRTVPCTTFSQHDFLGVNVYLPDRVVDWLTTLYGEHFMTPDPKWSMDDHKKRSVLSPDRLYRR